MAQRRRPQPGQVPQRWPLDAARATSLCHRCGRTRRTEQQPRHIHVAQSGPQPPAEPPPGHAGPAADQAGRCLCRAGRWRGGRAQWRTRRTGAGPGGPVPTLDRPGGPARDSRPYAVPEWVFRHPRCASVGPPTPRPTATSCRSGVAALCQPGSQCPGGGEILGSIAIQPARRRPGRTSCHFHIRQPRQHPAQRVPRVYSERGPQPGHPPAASQPLRPPLIIDKHGTARRLSQLREPRKHHPVQKRQIAREQQHPGLAHQLKPGTKRRHRPTARRLLGREAHPDPGTGPGHTGPGHISPLRSDDDNPRNPGSKRGRDDCHEQRPPAHHQ